MLAIRWFRIWQGFICMSAVCVGKGNFRRRMTGFMPAISETYKNKRQSSSVADTRSLERCVSRPQSGAAADGERRPAVPGELHDVMGQVRRRQRPRPVHVVLCRSVPAGSEIGLFRPRLAPPLQCLGTGLLFNFAGTVQSALGDPREVQIGMRYVF